MLNVSLLVDNVMLCHNIVQNTDALIVVNPRLALASTTIITVS